MPSSPLSPRLHGVLAPVVTPFDERLEPDALRFARHCRWLLSHGCNGLAVFGTNSEANSMSGHERQQLLDVLVEGGVPAASLMPGTGCCSITETAALTSHAVRLGCAGVLVLPPFYYKGVSDEGLFAHFSEVIERVANTRLRVYLYHIPPVAQVGITTGLVERLMARYGAVIAGLKDSSGDWGNTARFLDAFSATGFDVFAGSEVFLLRTLQNGGRGCITAGANVNPHGIGRLYSRWHEPDAVELQREVDTVRALLQAQPSMIPALKALIAHHAGDAGWARVRPPFVSLDEIQRRELVAAAGAIGFDMPGLLS